MATVTTNGIGAVIDGLREVDAKAYAAQWAVTAQWVQALVEAKSAGLRGSNTAEVRRAAEIRIGQHQVANQGEGVSVPASIEV